MKASLFATFQCVYKLCKDQVLFWLALRIPGDPAVRVLLEGIDWAGNTWWKVLHEF